MWSSNPDLLQTAPSPLSVIQVQDVSVSASGSQVHRDNWSATISKSASQDAVPRTIEPLRSPATSPQMTWDSLISTEQAEDSGTILAKPRTPRSPEASNNRLPSSETTNIDNTKLVASGTVDERSAYAQTLKPHDNSRPERLVPFYAGKLPTPHAPVGTSIKVSAGIDKPY